MRKNFILKLKDTYSESLIRDLIIFFFLFFLILAQGWNDILLLLFPVITFSFAIFFKMIDILKKKSEIDIIFNPLGYEKKNSNRLFFITFLQLIFLFWYGVESLYHPQLVDNYYLYFILIFGFFYSFGFFWLFIDVWKYSRIELLTKSIDLNETQKISINLENIISILKMKDLKIISIINFLVFITINLLNLIFAILIFNNILKGITYNLPGTGIENSKPIQLPNLIHFILVASPITSIILFFLIYRNVMNLDKDKFNKIISSIPSEIQNKIIDNLSTLNKKMKIKLSLE